MSDDAFTQVMKDSLKRTAETRTLAADALEYATTVFGHMLEGEDTGPLRIFASRFDRRELEATHLLTRELFGLLFETPEDVFVKGEVRKKQLVEYVKDERLEELGKYLRHAIDRSREGDPPTAETIIDFLANWLHTVGTDLVTAGMQNSYAPSESTSLARWRISLQGIEEYFISSIAAVNSAGIAERAAQDSLNARDAALAAAGQTGATTIGDHFSKVAASAKKDSRLWTNMTIGSIAAVVIAGALVLYWSRNSQITETLLHLVLVLPIVGLASYTARLAKYHQILGRWAEASSVLINSMPAFAKQISDTEMRERLILELSHGVFTKPIFGDEGKVEHVSPIPPDLINLLKEIAAKLPSRTG
ncbi:hypothetical protein [Mycobacteroides chelonae]|uniref:hypothetical protein n=1 Tax=Mycobacteroides chelonae TaxID=1774 RepID=UPI0008AA26F2|nr:hypothetical protein [Mycobacteroides chelonae]OHU53482.1 hypothetical protein BKG81_06740 [Mycobacteroides chelonae]